MSGHADHRPHSAVRSTAKTMHVMLLSHMDSCKKSRVRGHTKLLERQEDPGCEQLARRCGCWSCFSCYSTAHVLCWNTGSVSTRDLSLPAPTTWRIGEVYAYGNKDLKLKRL